MSTIYEKRSYYINFVTRFSQIYIFKIICLMCLVTLNEDTVRNLKGCVFNRIHKKYKI